MKFQFLPSSTAERKEFVLTMGESPRLYQIAGAIHGSFDPVLWNVATGHHCNAEEWLTVARGILVYLAQQEFKTPETLDNLSDAVSEAWVKALEIGYNLGQAGQAQRLEFFQAQGPGIIKKLGSEIIKKLRTEFDHESYAAWERGEKHEA